MWRAHAYAALAVFQTVTIFDLRPEPSILYFNVKAAPVRWGRGI